MRREGPIPRDLGPRGTARRPESRVRTTANGVRPQHQDIKEPKESKRSFEVLQIPTTSEVLRLQLIRTTPSGIFRFAHVAPSRTSKLVTRTGRWPGIGRIHRKKVTDMTNDAHGGNHDRRFRGAAIPNADETKLTIPIVRPSRKTGWRLNLLILSEELLGLHTHYATRTVPCGFPEHGCKFCNDGRPRTWRGYLAAYDLRRKGPCIAELPPAAARQLDDKTQGFASLRSIIIELERTSERDNAPIRLVHCERYEPESGGSIPQPFDLTAQLGRIWKADPFGEDSVPTETDDQRALADSAVEEFNAEIRLDEKTNGSPRSPKAYETTQSQRDMLAANRAALSVRSGEDD